MWVEAELGQLGGYRLGHQPGVAVQPWQGLLGGLVGAGPAEPDGGDLTVSATTAAGG
jgi:hypothetical protein